jgi:hypothetical protein
MELQKAAVQVEKSRIVLAPAVPKEFLTRPK